ncbi:lactonase family protein [Polaribacter sp. ALD11]|uniref:lactonase family protein n=1 Tax=Polaribacter sp. ALD11 TaxID=2058137 RepID=UPI001E5BD6B5|nr:lactonase family protein [Polaribacter sp. ALD11]
MEKENIFYVGTYTKKDSKGIYKFRLSKEGKLQNLGLAAAITNPSFLAKSKDGKTLFAVEETNENNTGFISSYEVRKDTLKFLSKQETGGAHPCFVAVNKDNYLLTANYTGGNIGLLKADKKGNIAPLSFVQQHIGKGITDRQKTPHAHSAWFHPTKDEVISVDLGTNELWFSTLDTTKKELVFTDQKKLKMAEGAGPRHLTFHPNNKWFYVLNELNNTVSLVKEKNDTYFVETSIATVPENFTGISSAADIHISKDGKFLYTSNRGHDTIAIFKLNSENGTLTTVGYQSVLGKNPRNFSLSPDEAFLLVANQDTDNIISFKRDATTGKLTFVAEVAAPMPVCILF